MKAILLSGVAAAAMLWALLKGPSTQSKKENANEARPRRVELRNRRILIDGEPQQIFAGEVHYFRLHPEVWEERLRQLKDSGCDTVATYMPWIWHELPDGMVDLTGWSHPQRNLVGFLELCQAHGLNVIARPGPFVMAELKNEGIPYRLYQDPTNLRPITWENKPVTTATLDYLSPAFLKEVRGWYEQIMPMLAQRQASRGGPVIGVQLCNEIGMLSWAANSPDLTDEVCEDMRRWACEKYGDTGASQRVLGDATKSGAWAEALRNPAGDALALHDVIGLYNRDRIRRYVGALRGFAEEFGISDVPFFINIHGTSNGRGRTFPIGISQLFESYRGQPQMTSGSDIYIGDLTVANLPDLYALNAFMGAVHDEHQPATSLEFEAGDGNYGDDFGSLSSPQAAVLKTRLCVAQGLRLLNYYLFAGGVNPAMEPHGDGLDRIAITGERHGFAAPIGPEGQENPTYGPMRELLRSLQPIKSILADSEPVYDDLALGFIPDHYMTEFCYRRSAERREQVEDMERFRGFGSRDVLVRNLLLAGFNFPAVDLQSGVPSARCVVLSTGRTMRKSVQENLALYVRRGGKLLLSGLLPDRDHDGSECKVLADALGLRDAGRVYDGWHGNGMYWASVTAQGWAAPRPDVRVGFAQLVASIDGSPLDAFMAELGSLQPCAVHVRSGAGEVIFFGCDYTADLDLFAEMMSRLGVRRRLQIEASNPGAIVIETRSSKGERLWHAINVAPYPVRMKVLGNDYATMIVLDAQSGTIERV